MALGLAAGASLAETVAFARHASARVTAQLYAGLTEDGREQAATKLVEAGASSAAPLACQRRASRRPLSVSGGV